MESLGLSDSHVSLELQEADVSPARETMHLPPSTEPTDNPIGRSPEAYGWSPYFSETEMPVHWGVAAESSGM